MLADLRPGAVVIGDRAYDSNALLTLVADAGGQTCTPTPRYRKQQRVIDVELYRQRNPVERFFNKLKHFRRIATRYDKLASNFLAAVALAAIRLWTRNYESTT
ncbi:Transposase [Erythrobacter litoralis]|nr:Transposase [Erythrobacter litoralis]